MGQGSKEVCRGCGTSVKGSGTRYCNECPNKHEQIGRKPSPSGKWCVICEEALPKGHWRVDTCFRPGCKRELRWRRGLWKKYKIRYEQALEMLERQFWACAVCKTPFVWGIDGGSPGMNVDHDHNCCSNARIGCGKCVRGLLCNGCNGGMGLFKDNPANLIAAAEYLISFKERTLDD